DTPSVAENAAIIRAMLAGDQPVPEPIRAQVAALVDLAKSDV
ncbi:MAG: DNA-binding protein YbiB, partial [Proteobacteria bacterium]|nr:DNA-binding protein YbiB [Pseudomonadota bacterium]